MTRPSKFSSFGDVARGATESIGTIDSSVVSSRDVSEGQLTVPVTDFKPNDRVSELDSGHAHIRSTPSPTYNRGSRIISRDLL